MTWVKLDDGFFQHVKVASVSKDAKLLHLSALCYCANQLTDGNVPRSSLRIIAAQADVDDYQAAVEELCAVALWHDEDGALSIHDYLKYNPSRADVTQQREAAAERMKRVRSGEVQANSGERSGEQAANIARSSPYPVPLPHPLPLKTPEPEPEVPTEPESGAKAPRRRSRKPLTDEQKAILHGRYAGAIDVEGAIAYALSTKYADKWTDEFLALDRWLKGDWEKATNRKFARNGSGNNLAGAGHGRDIAAAWSAALGREIGHGTGLLVEGGLNE